MAQKHKKCMCKQPIHVGKLVTIQLTNVYIKSPAASAMPVARVFLSPTRLSNKAPFYHASTVFSHVDRQIAGLPTKKETTHVNGMTLQAGQSWQFAPRKVKTCARYLQQHNGAS